MEVRDKTRSVNSIDVVFNFDCVGFTGTPPPAHVHPDPRDAPLLPSTYMYTLFHPPHPPVGVGGVNTGIWIHV